MRLSQLAVWAITITIPLASASSDTATNLQPLGASVTLNNIPYFISPFSLGKIRPVPHSKTNDSGLAKYGSLSAHFVPVSVVASSKDRLGALFEEWKDQDDVWQPGFLGVVLLADEDDNTNNHRDISDTGVKDGKGGAANGTTFISDAPSSSVLRIQNRDLASGPYFLDSLTGELHEAYRLYEDTSGSFIQSLLQRPDGRFQTLSAQIEASASITIGVPSRLYFTRTTEKPLAGVRIGIKDIFDLAGVRKSNGNRAWYAHYPPADTTARAVQNLLDAGAVVIGVQKTSQFANGEEPTADFVDYHAPFNPRGDGNQDASASSSGAGASVAAYEWLDLAVGTDTGDSIRSPATVNGVFGNRPTHGLVRLDGATPLSPSLDTVGLLARDPELWDMANAALFRGNYTTFAEEQPRYPTKLYTLDYPTNDSLVAEMLESFTDKLARFLNTKATPLDLHKEWARSAPAEVRGQTIFQLLRSTYAVLTGRDQIELVREPFYRDFAAANKGRLPYVNPISSVRWSWAESQPANSLDDARRNKTLFTDWFNDVVLPRSDEPSTCSSGLLLYTMSSSKLAPRDLYHKTPLAPEGFANSDISGFSEAPDSVFPLGEMPIYSPVTQHTEYFPVVINVVAARGCDALIGRLARDLVAEGILRIPGVGRRLHPEHINN